MFHSQLVFFVHH